MPPLSLKKTHTAKPKWLKVPLPGGQRYSWIKNQVDTQCLSTVCQEARCPNLGECWNGGTATFMIMGDTCTRGCRFCAVTSSKTPPPLDPEEPEKLALTISKMKLSYVVLTTVDRDDLSDQGASHIAECISKIKQKNTDLLIEILMPDFQGKMKLLDPIIQASPAVNSHNLETVARLTPLVRDRRAGYQQSLDVLNYLKQHVPQGYTKSSLMLGLGETLTEVHQAMADLRHVGVDFLTLGQYLQPSSRHLKVEEYVTPETFKSLEQTGLEMGFESVASGPLVRSSYKAAEFFIQRTIRHKNR
ncbi:lipoyl synthase [Deltaproteobacteria bacterium TL4]